MILRKSIDMFLGHIPARIGQKHIYTTNTKFDRVCDILQKWQQKFELNNVSEPLSSIQHIVAFNLGIKNFSDIDQLRHKTFTPQQNIQIDQMCEQRLKRVPVQYIIGEWDFRQLTLKMRPPVFIPRPETEMLVDLVLREVDEKNLSHVVELCCGSGAICLSLLYERPKLQVTAIDQSEEACVLTKENAQRYQLCKRLCVVRSKVTQGNRQLGFLRNKLDLIVSNPPYVPKADLDKLDPEILLYEDLAALDGGETGLNVIKLILNLASGVLLPGGKLFLEVDISHPELIEEWLVMNKEMGLLVVGVYRDFCDRERFVVIEKTTRLK